MGFFDNQENMASSGTSDVLDLVAFEHNLVQNFNDTEILSMKFKAEEFGLTFKKKATKKSGETPEKELDLYLYQSDEKVTICPEPLSFLKEFDAVGDNAVEADKLFRNKIETFQCMVVKGKPGLKDCSENTERMWMNKTLSGINLRPGNLNGDCKNFEPVRMCDDNVHGLIAGRTGSGKSVFINALILSLITEYPPWELDLYLADFKKVELSRYMNNSDAENKNTPFTPHVNACAATSEIRYVISLIRYLVNCMNARQEFFARLGVTKIQEFRNKYNLVLPRVLLIVDEFQQLFTEATEHEKTEIQTMLNSVTKLGRATGFHLIFASQEMSQTLNGNTLANFKIRMALPCSPQISVDVLGNRQAANLERGYVFINTDSGDEMKNRKYQVPFIETDEKDDESDRKKTPFYAYLDIIKKAGRQFDLKYKISCQKFYREELQETEAAYQNDLDKIQDQKNQLVAQDRSLFDAVVLGKTVLYSPKRNDKVSFYIEKGMNKGVMIASPNVDDVVRIRKLLSENLFRSDLPTWHFGVERNNLIFEKYRIDNHIKRFSAHHYYNCEIDKPTEYLLLFYGLRHTAAKIMDTSKKPMEELYKLEKQVLEMLKFQEKIDLKRKEKKELEKRITELEYQIGRYKKGLEKEIPNPFIMFFEKCSKEIILVSKDNTPADWINLGYYKNIVSNFSVCFDLKKAENESIKLLEEHLKKINDIKIDTNEEKAKVNRSVSITRNKLFQHAIHYFAAKYNEDEAEKKKINEQMDKIYESVKMHIPAYKEYCKKAEEDAAAYEKWEKEKEEKQKELENKKSDPNDIDNIEEKMSELINKFVSSIFTQAYSEMGYTGKKIPEIPKAVYKEENQNLIWELNFETANEKVKLVGDDILQIYMEACRGKKTSSDSFKKVVFWINGLDEIGKWKDNFVVAIRNAINQNILVIAITTSELGDSIIYKAFDYAFITGNIEKFYYTFGVKPTKQPLDSIVVHLRVRSKGFDIPFKMYRSNLEDVQTPNFLDQLLNT